MESLERLENNLTALLTAYQKQQECIDTLSKELERRQNDLIQAHAQLAQLKTDYQHLQTAHALISSPQDTAERMRIRQRITNLIAQIDRAMELLKQ